MKRLHRHYNLHQLALLPAIQADSVENWEFPGTPDMAGFAQFLGKQKMHGFWADALESHSDAPGLSLLKAQLHVYCKITAALELPQRQLMQEAHELLTAANIQYFFAKGAQLRQVVYQKTWHRPAIDVDAFIDKKDREKAVIAFRAHGFSTHLDPATISHEMTLRKTDSQIDLHWHLMRPSRYRQQLDTWLFERREKFDEFWGLDATANLLVMLTHPAITKYLISPTSMLIHQVDQIKLMETGQIEWDTLIRVLHDTGLKTAAWSSVYLLQLLTGRKTDSDFEKAISPGLVKRRYLQSWIDNAWISRLFEHRWLVAGGFNLPLQDSITDMARAAGMTLRSKLKKSGNYQ